MILPEMLQTGASQFTTNASKLKRKYWWKNLKVSWIFSKIRKKYLVYLDVGYSYYCDCK